MNDGIQTDFGIYRINDDGSTTLHAARDELVRWANRPGLSWPCSDLERLDWIEVKLDQSGDIVDWNQEPLNVEPMSDELSAWISDVVDVATSPLN